MTKRGLTKLIGATNYAALLQDSGTLMSAYDRGADDPVTAGIVGDTGDSAPANWWQRDGGWALEGTAPSSAPLDMLVTIYTQTSEAREQFVQTLLAMIPAGADGTPSVKLAYRRDCDPLDPPDGIHSARRSRDPRASGPARRHGRGQGVNVAVESETRTWPAAACGP